jgi:Tol biopolymer transport system component
MDNIEMDLKQMFERRSSDVEVSGHVSASLRRRARLQRFATVSAVLLLVVLSATGGLVAFRHIDTDGGGPTRISNGHERSEEVAFVVTGANTGPYPGPATMYVSSLHGAHRRVLVASDRKSWYYGPSWSPDGSRFAYLSFGIHFGPCVLYVANRDGTEAHEVHRWGTNCPSVPSWSPDASELVFARGHSLYVVTPHGGAVRQIWTCDPQTLPQQQPRGCWTNNGVAWSPDGSQIAVAVWSYQGGGIFVVSAEGKTATRISVCGTRLCSAGGRDEGPVWSPDGSAIAFWRNGNLYRMYKNGTGLRQLTRCRGRLPSCYGPPQWSPNGSKLLFSGPNGLYVMPADGGKVHQVGDEPGGAVWVPPLGG